MLTRFSSYLNWLQLFLPSQLKTKPATNADVTDISCESFVLLHYTSTGTKQHKKSVLKRKPHQHTNSWTEHDTVRLIVAAHLICLRCAMLKEVDTVVHTGLWGEKICVDVRKHMKKLKQKETQKWKKGRRGERRWKKREVYSLIWKLY